jgi:hypothetical protein
MPLAAGTISQVTVYSTNANLTSAVATGGTSPYTYQWYRSLTPGFTPGGGNILAGKTTLSLADTGLTADTTYYYKVVATDSASPAATATSNQLGVTTTMTLTAGTITVGTVTSTTAQLTVTAATSGTSPYTYQWYRSTTTGFTPGGGNIIAGATSLTLSDSGLIPGTVYYYKNVVTDSASPAATSTATQATATTSNPVLNPNQFSQVTIVGMVDMPYNFNTHPVQIDLTQTGTLYAGAAVKIAAGTVGGVPKVVACTASTDQVYGFLNYDIKNVGWVAGQAAEVSLAGNVMYLYATGAITQGAQVELDISTNGGVATKGSAGNRYVGWAYDGAAAAGALIRVYLVTPSYAVFS